MHKLSAIVTCYNESQHIEAVLQSLTWCDEILVVDSYSKDDTFEKAKKYTPQVLQHKYESPSKQKNWIIPQAANEWILLLDADERVTGALQKEIQEILAQNTIPFDAFWIFRKNHFMGKEIRYSGWQRDKVIRLFHRDACRYKVVEVHEEIETSGKIGYLKNRLLHYTYSDLEQYLVKWNRYSTLSAVDHARKTGKPNAYHFIVKPIIRFLKHYIIDLGFLDGYPGFIISKLAAQGVFFRYMKLYNMRKKERDFNP